MTEQTRPALCAPIEALLFAAEGPLSAEVIRDAVARADDAVVAPSDVETALQTLRAEYASHERGFQLVELGSGWELRTRAAYAPYINALYQAPPVRLSRAALEVLAIVAYRQPVTRADVEDIRGVDCSRMLRTLLERELIRIIGKADDVGRPLLYGTAPTFLSFFGLSSLAELPTLRDYTELSDDHVVKLQELEETLRANAASPTPAETPAQAVPDVVDGLPLETDPNTAVVETHNNEPPHG